MRCFGGGEQFGFFICKFRNRLPSFGCLHSCARYCSSRTAAFFGGQELLTITHIPAGRVLAALMSFYTQLTGRDGWRKFNDVSVEELQNSKLPVFNLALFTDAWGYENGGAITSLTLENLSENALWAGLFRSFAMQYVRALDNLKISGRKEIILSGGKLSQSNVLLHYLNKKQEFLCVWQIWGMKH